MLWQDHWFKQLQGLLRPRQLAVIEACLIGLISGCAAVLLKYSVSFFGGARLHWSTQYPDWLILPVVGAIGGWLSGWLIEHWGTDAVGSGIPQVKIALAGLPTQLNGRLAIVKLVSTLLSLGAGLSLGRQGPTVQIGAAIAAQVSRWLPTSPEHQRQLIAAGAAAGLAAGFNAPIAGVLFVIEELLQDASGLTLGTAILASFVGAVVSRLLGGYSILNPNLMNVYPTFAVGDVPLFLLLGGLAGSLSVVFIRGILLSHRLQQKFLKYGLAWRISAIGLMSGLVIALLPAALRGTTSLQEIWNTKHFNWYTSLLVFIVRFGLTLLASGSGAPGGLFAPSLILGSTLGYMVADGAGMVQSWMPWPIVGTPASENFSSTFALTGMAAFFSAVTRGPITAIIIVFEMTGDFNLILPLMISSVTAYWVGESISSGSIYKYLIAAKGIKLNKQVTDESKLSQLKARDIMQRQVETLSSQMTIEEAKQFFNNSHHRGFPIVRSGELVGILTASDLTRSERQGDEVIADVMTANPVTVKLYDSLSQVLYLLNRYKISRLPVLDRQKLVGIITRADIIRAESEQLTGEHQEAIANQDPSYVVYQTRDPEIGLGRLLVPISNPNTAETLLKIACAIATENHYEIECVQIILIPQHQPTAETPVSTLASRQMMEKVSQIAQSQEIAIHTQIRVAHDVAEAILETIAERHIDLLVMGWLGINSKAGFIFGSVVDTLIRQAACSMALVKFPTERVIKDLPMKFDRWLLPSAGGPNSRHAMKLLPALLSLAQHPEVILCNVISQETTTETAQRDLDRTVKVLQKRIDAPIQPIQQQHESIADAIVELAIDKECDVIMLGATRMGLLQQVIQGNIPEAIARQSQCTVILIRNAMS